MIVFPDGYSPDHEVKCIFLNSHMYSYPCVFVFFAPFIIFHSYFPNTQILKHDTKVTRSSTNGSFLTVNVSIIIRSFLEVTKMSQILSLEFNDR